MPKDTAKPTDWSLVQRIAEELAISALGHRKDYASERYLDHVARVARNVREVPGFTAAQREAAVAAAWLKDVLAANREDFKPFDRQELLAAGIPNEVVTAVVLHDSMKAITLVETPTPRTRAYNYGVKLEFNAAVKKNPIARLLRIAYISEMLNYQRGKTLERCGVGYGQLKYELALAMLELTEEQWDWFELSIQRTIKFSKHPKALYTRARRTAYTFLFGPRFQYD